MEQRSKQLPHPDEQVSRKMYCQLYSMDQLREELAEIEEMSDGDRQGVYGESIYFELDGKIREIGVRHTQLLEEEESFGHRYFGNKEFEAVMKEAKAVRKRLASTIYKRGSTSYPLVNVKLPKITIPHFDGDYESWTAFYDLFQKIIHESDSLSATENMQYLKTHVRGDAAKLINHLTVCDAHYQTAWTLLTKRYKNERILVTKYIDKILNYSEVAAATSGNLRDLHDTFNESLEAIKCHNVDISSWDPILTRILSTKWDRETNEKYEQQLAEPNKPQKFVDMMKFLEKRFQCLEASISHSEVLAMPWRESRCWCCHGDHTIYQCEVFKSLSIQERNREVEQSDMCKNCLMHKIAFPCRSVKRCTVCKKRGHHTYLHEEKSKTSQPEVNRVISNVCEISEEARRNEVTLLPTAQVFAHDRDGRCHVFRVLLDQGSEESFCTEEVAGRLSYPRIEQHTEVVGIGDEKPKISSSYIQVKLRPINSSSAFKLPVELIVLPKLTQSVPSHTIQPINRKFWNDKVSADYSYYKKGPIDIILGVKEYQKVLRGGLEKIGDTLVAQETKFGWILSGQHRACEEAIVRSHHVTSMVSQKAEEKGERSIIEIKRCEPRKTRKSITMNQLEKSADKHNVASSYVMSLLAWLSFVVVSIILTLQILTDNAVTKYKTKMNGNNSSVIDSKLIPKIAFQMSKVEIAYWEILESMYVTRWRRKRSFGKKKKKAKKPLAKKNTIGTTPDNPATTN